MLLVSILDICIYIYLLAGEFMMYRDVVYIYHSTINTPDVLNNEITFTALGIYLSMH